MIKFILIILVIFTGIFLFKVPFEHGIVHTPQLVWFIFSASILGSSLIFGLNKYLGLLAGVGSLGFLRTVLLSKASILYVREDFLIGVSIFVTYYAVRMLKIRLSVFKYFLIPGWINILFIFIQVYNPALFPFMGAVNITGLLGNAGFTAVFLGLLVPVFIKYCPIGVPLLFYAIILCNGGVGFIAGLVSGLVYLFFTHKTTFKIVIISILIILPFYSMTLFRKSHYSEFKARLAYAVFTLDGIKQHPFLGWGLSSYPSIVARIPNRQYLGVDIKTPGVMNANHPHNEILSGWWNFGILCPLLIIGYLISIVKRFEKKFILSFAIISGAVAASLGTIFTAPVWFLTALALGIYENKEVNDVKE